MMIHIIMLAYNANTPKKYNNIRKTLLCYDFSTDLK